MLRLLVLKHIRNLSYATLEREVRANLVYRDFTRVGGEKMPNACLRWPCTLSIESFSWAMPVLLLGRTAPLFRCWN